MENKYYVLQHVLANKISEASKDLELIAILKPTVLQANVAISPDWISVFLDTLIFLSFISIPLGLLYLLRHADPKRTRLFVVLFTALIFLLGLTIYLTTFHPSQLSYWLTFGLKVLTILVSTVTIWTLIPRIIRYFSYREGAITHPEIQQQTGEKNMNKPESVQPKENLEQLIQKRTKQLESTIEQLQNEIQTHQASQKQTQFQTSLLEQVNTAIVGTDLQFKITFWNKHAEKVFGWTPQEVLGRPVLDILVHPDKPQWGQQLLKKLEQKITFSGETSAIQKSGISIPMEIHCSPVFDVNSQQIGYTAVAVDMSAYQKNERKLQDEKEKAEKMAVAKQDFLATMSHEIRTPLNVIIGMTRLLRDGNPRHDQQEYLKSLQFSASHLLTIINDILDMAKIEAGKIKLEKVSFNVQEVVEGVKKAFSVKAREKGLQLKVSMDPKTPQWLIGDQVRLTQVLNNLVSNAVKFTEQGFVSIKVSTESQLHNKARLSFKVADSGIGISEDKLEQIFDRFTQAKEDTTRRFGGSGLGLTICKRLIELQKGHIHVKSQEGNGTTFRFSLNYNIGQSDTKKFHPEPAGQYPLNNIRLLLVDDDEANCVVASNFLNKMGVQVSLAENGQMAIEAVRAQQYDIVLMDLQMPIIDGYEATRAIRKLGGQFINLPIVALTADVVSDVRERVSEAGMNDYIAKPFDPDQLNAVIARHLNIRKEPPPQGAENQEITTLCQILDDYQDDVRFVNTLLSSLVDTFQHLSAQIKDTAEHRDVTSLRRTIHKLTPTIRMMESYPLEDSLVQLKEKLSASHVDDEEVSSLLEQIHAQTTAALQFLDKLAQRAHNRKTKLS